MSETLARIFFKRASKLDSAVAVKFKEGRGPYRDLSWTEFAKLVKELAFGLSAIGIEHGDAAAIFSQTSHLWIAADLAVIANGGVTVPVYPTSSQSDIRYILDNSGSTVVFVQNELLLKKVLMVSSELPALKKIVLMSSLSGGKSLTELAVDPDLVLCLEELQQMGRERQQSEPNLIEQRIERTTLDDCATIIYTSGTTGTPKGAVLTHGNILSVMNDLDQIMPISEQDVYLSFLPLSHVFERVCGEYYWMHSGGCNAIAEGIEHMAKNMAEVQPTMILVVPRVLDRIYAKVKSGIEGASGNARALIEWAVGVGRQRVNAAAQGQSPSAWLSAQLWLAERLVFKKLRQRINPRLNLVVSGGAPASKEAIEFFNAIGITTLEGYGLTETTAPAAVNRRGRIKAGTVGSALPSVELRIAEDGEILIKGKSVFRGYHNNHEASKEAFDGEWFRSGDIGTIDGDGYLTITDRKKDIIVNSSGKNIAPQKIEAIIKTAPLVTQCVVFGDRRKTLVALITLDEHQTMDFAREKGWRFESWHELVTSGQLYQMLQGEIHKLSAELPDYERVRNFAILDEDLSVEKGELTATLKIKRNVVALKYKGLIDSLYKEDAALVSSRR